MRPPSKTRHDQNKLKRLWRTGTLKGMTVRKGNCRATVRTILKDTDGGVILDKYIEGFRYWNIQELALV